MLLRLALIIGVIWMLFSERRVKRVERAATQPPTAPAISPRVMAQLSDADRARALENAVATWKAARAEENARPPEACRRTHD